MHLVSYLLYLPSRIQRVLMESLLNIYHPTVLVIVQKTHETSTNIPRYWTVSYCTLGYCAVESCLPCLGTDVAPHLIHPNLWFTIHLLKISAKKVGLKSLF